MVLVEQAMAMVEFNQQVEARFYWRQVVARFYQPQIVVLLHQLQAMLCYLKFDWQFEYYQMLHLYYLQVQEYDYQQQYLGLYEGMNLDSQFC